MVTTFCCNFDMYMFLQIETKQFFKSVNWFSRSDLGHHKVALLIH